MFPARSDAVSPGFPVGRDLASVDLWDRSLARSRHRRYLAELGRRARRRRKSASLAVSAALAAGPVIPPAVAAADAGTGTTPAGTTDTGSDALLQAGARHVVLQTGSTGALVAAAQRRLDQVLPLADLAVDGIYGPLTRHAVREFQHRHRLAVTGNVDVRTWAIMFRAPVLVFGGAAGPTAGPATTAPATSGADASPVAPAAVAPAHHPAAVHRYFASATVARRQRAAAPSSAAAHRTAHAVTSAPADTAAPDGSTAPAPADAATPAPADAATPAPAHHTTPGRHGGSTGTGRSAGSSSAPPIAVVAPSGPTTTQPSTYVLTDGVALPLPRQYIANGSVDQGVDYSAPGGTPLYAMGDGVIIGEGISGFGPNAPILQITSGPLKGLEVYYGHAGSDLVHVGQHVQAGEQISQVGYGIVGISTGPHLEIGFYPPGAMGAGSRMLSVIDGLLNQHSSGRAWGNRGPTAVAASLHTSRATTVKYTVRRSGTATRSASTQTVSGSGGAALSTTQAAPAPVASAAPAVTATATPAPAPAPATTTTSPAPAAAAPAPATTAPAPAASAPATTTTSAAAAPAAPAPAPATTTPAPAPTATTAAPAPAPTTTAPAPAVTTPAPTTTTPAPTDTTSTPVPAPTTTAPATTTPTASAPTTTTPVATDTTSTAAPTTPPAPTDTTSTPAPTTPDPTSGDASTATGSSAPQESAPAQPAPAPSGGQ